VIGRTEDYINVVFPRKKYRLNKYSKRIAQLFIVHIHTLNKIHKRVHLSLSLSLTYSLSSYNVSSINSSKIYFLPIPTPTTAYLISSLTHLHILLHIISPSVFSSPLNFRRILLGSSFVRSFGSFRSYHCSIFILSIYHLQSHPKTFLNTRVHSLHRLKNYECNFELIGEVWQFCFISRNTGKRKDVTKSELEKVYNRRQKR